MTATTVGTVIVAYRSEDVIRQAVVNAFDLGGQVVVVDHGDGASAELAAGAGAVVIHDSGNPGFGAGQNRGVAITEAPYVLLCNPDADIAPDAIRAGVAVLDRRPDVAAVQGVVVNRATGRPERSAGLELGPIHLLGRAVGAAPSCATGGCRRWPAAPAPSVTTPTECRPVPPRSKAWPPPPSSCAGPPSTPSAASTSPTSSTARTSTSAAGCGTRAGPWSPSPTCGPPT